MLATSTQRDTRSFYLNKMGTVQPTPRTWILRLKHHTTTIFLHVDPAESFDGLKSNLLEALEQTHPTGEINGAIIPKDINNVLLAKPISRINLSKGWELLQKSKGEASTIKADTNSSKLLECPQGMGLKDGGVVAFKFRSETKKQTTSVQEHNGEELDIITDKQLDEEWDVVIPTIEETYDDDEDEDQKGEGLNIDVPKKKINLYR